MSKLINGRPISELVADGRKVIALSKNGDLFVIIAHDEINPSYYLEWAEILKPEPKPDANGWWNTKDKLPEVGDIVQYCEKRNDFNAGYKILTITFESGIVHESFTHWKLWEGPVE